MDRDEDFEEDGFAVVAPPAALKKAKSSSSSKSASSSSSSVRPKAKKPQTQPQPVKKKAPPKKAASSAPAGKKPAKSSADDVDMAAASDSSTSSDDAPLSKLKSNSIAKAKQAKEKAAAKPKPKPKAVKLKANKAVEAAAVTSAPTAAAAKKKSRPKPKPKAKVEAPTASRSPSPARRPSSGMLSVFELCNTDDDGNGNDGRRADRDVEDGDDDDDDEEDNASTIGSEAGRRGGVPIDVDADDEEEDGDEEETTSTVDGDDASDQDEGWSDHNRWYCNICKDGGELLCCDRCPRAFHMSCLGMGETAIPDTEWFCKMCSECLDRRRAKSEKKEKARLLREAEKLERDAKKLQLKQQKEEMIAKKSVDAIENKAKRVLEMQDRILSRKKIKYKDKEEEKLGKLAEDLAQTVRDAKEKLEKLEKEDASLKKKEEALNKKKKGIDDLPDDIDSTSRSDKPTPQECNFGSLPSKHMGAVLAVWDSISSFSKILNLSPISVEQFGSALAHQEHSALMTEIHMCLLDLIMEDREDEDYMSDDESAMDERERYRYEVQHAPLTVGVPTLTMLNSLSWPSVLHSLIVAVPRYTAHATADFREAIHALYNTEYPKLSVCHKLSLLNFLVRRAFGTEKIRQMLGKHLGETIQASKEFNRAVLQDRKVALEDEKKLREKQKAELAGLVEKSKTSVKTWLKPDSKKNASNSNADTADENEDDAQSDSGAPGSASDSDLDDLAYNEEALANNEEELERLQVEDRISRHEYLSRKKSLEVQRERLRKKAEEKLRKQRMQEQMERKRTAAKKGIQEGLLSKDASLLRVAIEKGKECSLPERIIVSATHVLEILEAEAVREEEADTRKRKFNEMIRSSFVRTEPLGRDRNQCRYWILQGDKQRLYIEKPGSSEKLKLKYEAMENGGSVKSEANMNEGDGAIWYCYSSEAEVIALVDSLDIRITREAQLKTSLTENFDLITADMPMSKPGLLISDLLNEDSANGKKRQRKGNGAASSVPTDFSVWRNERKTWRKKLHAVVGVDSFREDLIEVEAWLSKRLKDYGSNWQERAPGGHVDWLKNVKSVAKIVEFVAPLLSLETEVMSFQLKAQGLPATTANGAQEVSKTGGESNRAGDNDKSDDEDDDEDELDALTDDGSILWPTPHCRNRWIEEVKKAKTIATLSVALASFEQRLDVFGLAEAPNEDQGVSTRRAKNEKEKQSRKERAAKKNQSKEESEEISSMRDSNDEWEEDCYICSEGGELLCCDGCPRVFHYTCAGLRRIPRGKTFCHVCDASVKPIFPVTKTTRSSADARKDKDAQAGASDARTASSNGANASKEVGDHIHPAGSGKPQMTTRSSEDQWDVDCSVCALGGELLCCDGCPRAFHVACIGLEKIPDDEWFCNECNLQTCGACKKNKIRLDSHVICGSEDGTKGCERVFHLKCAKLSAVPEDDWFCKKCRSSSQK